jgi:hypothetical protein
VVVPGQAGISGGDQSIMMAAQAVKALSLRYGQLRPTRGVPSDCVPSVP